MTRTKKGIALFFAIVMLVSNIFTVTVPVSAATCSNGTYTQTFTVTTKETGFWKPYIVISQSKGVFKPGYNPFYDTKKEYGWWNVSYKATDGSDEGGNEYLDGSYVKIRLQRGKKYKFTISWAGGKNHPQNSTKGTFIEYPTWEVSKKCNISKCN